MVGATVSHYQILERLGGGGMGVVFKAHDLRLNRTVALKFLPPDLTRDADARERFIHEAHAASALDHPNICNIHEIDETPDGRTFLCMAFYDGSSLKNEIERGPVAMGHVLDIAVQVAQGLARAHEAGIIHRDIKPANVMVTVRGEVKVIDFGLAKLAGQTTLTGAQHLLGTAAYMSPEQVRGDPVDRRTDIWSFGITLYEMVAGIHPFKCDNREATFYSILSREPRPVTELSDDVPIGLDRIIRCCLEKEPADRFQSMAPLLDDLKGVRDAWARSNGGHRRRRTYPWLRLRRTLKPWKVPATVGVIIAGGVVAWVVLFGWPHSSSFAEGKHLAVLPFLNIGNDSTHQVLYDGLWETVTCRLTQLEQFDGSLWVVPTIELRTCDVASASEARKMFGVNLVFSISVQWQRDLIVLALNLVDAVTLRQVHSELLTEHMSNISSIQVDLIATMTRMLEFEYHQAAQRTLAAGGTAIASAYEHYLKGCGHMLRADRPEKIEAAIECFALAIREDSLYALAYAGLGEAYWAKYNATKDTRLAAVALEQCKRAVALDRGASATHVTMGLVHAGMGQYGEALQDYSRALLLDSVNSDALRGMALAYSALGESDKAERTYKRAITLKPEYWAGYNALGVFYYSQGRYDDAIAQFEQVVRHTPDNTRGYNNLGGLHFLSGNWEEARKAWERSLEIDTSDVGYSQLGTLYFYMGRYEQASEMFRGALRFVERDNTLWGNLGASLYWTPDRRSEATAAFRTAVALASEELQVNPRDEEVLTNLASYYAMLGERERALEVLERVCTAQPTNPDIMARIADSYELVGNRDSAVVWIGRAIEGGYSLRMLNTAPGMKELREDARVRALVSSRGN